MGAWYERHGCMRIEENRGVIVWNTVYMVWIIHLSVVHSEEHLYLQFPLGLFPHLLTGTGWVHCECPELVGEGKRVTDNV